MESGKWRGSLALTGGGSFIQLAIHQIDMVQWLLDDRIVRVAAYSRNMMCPNIGGDDVTAAACEFASGILGTLSSSYCAMPFLLAIYGTNGYISLTSDDRLEILLDRAFSGEIIRYDRPDRLVTFEYGFDMGTLCREENPYDQHIAFVRAVQEGKPVPVPLEAGLDDLRVVQAVYRSAQEKTSVEVPVLRDLA